MMAGMAGAFLSPLSKSAMISIEAPIKVSIPNQMGLAGVKTRVTTVMAAPHKNTMTPRRTIRLDKPTE